MDKVKVCECGCGSPVVKRFVVGHNMHGDNLSGRVFGKITVLKPLKKFTSRRKWRCKCVCGKEFDRRGSVLLTGKSPGCRSCNNGYKKRPFESLYNFLVAQAKNRTTVRLTYEEYLSFTKKKNCHYCGVALNWKPHANSSRGHKLDRKDNSIGYTKGNCVVCCPRCNWAKSDHFTYDEWKQIGNLIRGWNGSV